MEDVPVDDSQCNGGVENGVQQVQGMVRTLSDALDSRYGERVYGVCMMIPWMVMHAAATMSRFKVGRDEKTPLQMIKGKKSRQPQLEFGECIMKLNLGTEGLTKRTNGGGTVSTWG